MVNWKKILKWTVIIFVILFIIGIISNNKQKNNNQGDLGDIAENLDLGDGDRTAITAEIPPIETDNSNVDVGLTQEEIDQLEQDLNDLQVEDLEGLE